MYTVQYIEDRHKLTLTGFMIGHFSITVLEKIRKCTKAILPNHVGF